MSAIVNRIRKGFYLDSVALMRLSQTLSALPGVATAALMIGTPSNVRIMDDAGLLDDAGRKAGANDLIIAVKAADAGSAAAALDEADAMLARPNVVERGGGERRPRSLDAAIAGLGGASLALISVPGAFAAAEARKALARGLHAMIFSDNVSYEDERALKLEARDRGLLVMGPDCGTALISGTPLAFANQIPKGDIGIIAAAGTGLQEVACLIARGGKGVSHGIGTGGRDLSEKIGGLTALAAIDALDADAATKHIVIVSKPPAKSVADAVLARVAKSPKRFTICFLGADGSGMPANARFAPTLAAAAADALGGKGADAGYDIDIKAAEAREQLAPARRWVRGIYSGGTLCAEAQLVMRAAEEPFWSNAPVPGSMAQRPASGHSFVDYGADEYTVGRPHPMIDPTVRDAAMAQALEESGAAVVLIDIVIGFGAHADPAGAAARVVGGAGESRPAVVASVVGTDFDPQHRASQVRKLEQAGILVAPSNARAAELALAISRLR
jgi:FdrA protein